MHLKLAAASLIALSILAQSPAPQEPKAPTKTTEQQLAEAKAENERLTKLLNAWVQKSISCEVSLTTAQTLGTPAAKEPEKK